MGIVSNFPSGSSAVATTTKKGLMSATDKTLIDTGIATLQTSLTASRAYGIDDCFVYEGTLYTVTSSVAQGDTFVVGTNCVAKNIADRLVRKLTKAQYEALSAAEKAADIVYVITDDDSGADVYSKSQVDALLAGTEEELTAALDAQNPANWGLGTVVAKRLDSTYDLNSVATNGFYSWQSSNYPLNVPLAGYTGSMLVVARSNDELMQIVSDPYDKKVFIRLRYGVTWSAWKEIATMPDVTNLAQGMAILSDGNTHVAITSGQYVYVRSHSTLADGLYEATANIAANGTLSTSNVTAVSGGGLNDIMSNLALSLGNASTQPPSAFPLGVSATFNNYNTTPAYGLLFTLRQRADIAGSESRGRMAQIGIPRQGSTKGLYIRTLYDDAWTDWSFIGAKTKINVVQSNITSSANTFTYTGISVTIPANSYFALYGFANYVGQAGTGAALSTSNSVNPDTATGSQMYHAKSFSDHNMSTSLCGYMETSMTLYLWCRWAGGATNNKATLTGWYEPAS